MVSGKPVIAFAKGGALETVVENQTGIFFEHQTKESLIDAVKRFDSKKFNANDIHQHVLKFDREIFKDRLKEYFYEKFVNSL